MSGHNRFSNQRTRTRRKNHMLTTAPSASFPVAKHDQIWPLGRCIADLGELLRDYRTSAVYTHTVDTPPGSSITDRMITDDTCSARRRIFFLKFALQLAKIHAFSAILDKVLVKYWYWVFGIGIGVFEKRTNTNTTQYQYLVSVLVLVLVFTQYLVLVLKKTIPEVLLHP